MQFQCFDVAARYFEGIFLDLKRKTKQQQQQQQQKAQRKGFITHIECSDVLVECDKLAPVSVAVCGAAEAPEEQAGK